MELCPSQQNPRISGANHKTIWAGLLMISVDVVNKSRQTERGLQQNIEANKEPGSKMSYLLASVTAQVGRNYGAHNLSVYVFSVHFYFSL